MTAQIDFSTKLTVKKLPTFRAGGDWAMPEQKGFFLQFLFFSDWLYLQIFIVLVFVIACNCILVFFIVFVFMLVSSSLLIMNYQVS